MVRETTYRTRRKLEIKNQSSPSKKRHYGTLPPLRIAHRYLKPATELTVRRRDWMESP